MGTRTLGFTTDSRLLCHLADCVTQPAVLQTIPANALTLRTLGFTTKSFCVAWPSPMITTWCGQHANTQAYHSSKGSNGGAMSLNKWSK